MMEKLFNDLNKRYYSVVDFYKKEINDKMNISNNEFKFQLFNLDNTFFGLMINYLYLTKKGINNYYYDLCVLCEYLMINNNIYFDTLLQKNHHNESKNMLSVLDLNLLILKNLNSVLIGIEKHDYLKEILDLPKPNNLNLLESKDKYRQNLVDLFLKIIS